MFKIFQKKEGPSKIQIVIVGLKPESRAKVRFLVTEQRQYLSGITFIDDTSRTYMFDDLNAAEEYIKTRLEFFAEEVRGKQWNKDGQLFLGLNFSIKYLYE